MNRLILVIVVSVLCAGIVSCGSGLKKDGMEIDYYTNGVVKYKGEYKNGKPIGPHYWYFEDASLEHKKEYHFEYGMVRHIEYYRNRNFKRDIKVEVPTYKVWYEKMWREDGSLETLIEYDHEKRKISEFDSNERLIKVVNYFGSDDENLILHGLYQEFYPNEQIKVEGMYDKGKEAAVWKYYSQDGELKNQKQF